MIRISKNIWIKVLTALTNDTFLSAVGLFFSIINGFCHYFHEDTQRGIFWIVVAIFCLVNMKKKD